MTQLQCTWCERKSHSWGNDFNVVNIKQKLCKGTLSFKLMILESKCYSWLSL